MYESKVEKYLKKPLAERVASPIHQVAIEGNVFEDYGDFSFFWEKTYQKQPSRSISGVMSNLDTMPTFLVPHLKIKYSLMSIEDYRRLANLIISKNEFSVTCYDAISQENTTNKMYFLPDEMPEFFSIAHQAESGNWTEIIGVKDYTIEMVGTLSEYDGKEITISYYFPVEGDFEYYFEKNNFLSQFGTPTVVGNIKIKGYNDEAYRKLIEGDILKDIYGNEWQFVGWRKSNSKAKYLDGEEYSFFSDTTLHMAVEKLGNF